MNISFHGAARVVTGSKHLLHLDSGKKILLDCGMFQGMGKRTLELNTEWGFDPVSVSYVIVSHAHIDHVGLLPKLVRDGFRGKIYCTPQTAELARILLLDSAHIQEFDADRINAKRRRHGRPGIEPLYTTDDAEKVFDSLVPVPYNTPFAIDEEVELLYTDCGHILGSAAVSLKINENGKEVRLTFSGDIGRYNDLILRAPDTFPQADYIIIESTYGDRLHAHKAPPTDLLLEYIVATCVTRKGKLIIPAFSVGRTQEILYLLNRLEMEHRLPPIKYYVDSPLSISATNIIKRHPECFNKQVKELLEKDDDVFAFKGLHFIEDTEASIALSDTDEPCVIIAASGMAEAGRVKHHIERNIDSRNNTILIVGYCEPHSLGGELMRGAKRVSIYGDQQDVIAHVGVIESMSAHGDYDDLLHWLSCQDAGKVSRVFIVHGEYETQTAFRRRLVAKGFADTEIPDMHQSFDLG